MDSLPKGFFAELKQNSGVSCKRKIHRWSQVSKVTFKKNKDCQRNRKKKGVGDRKSAGFCAACELG